MHFLLPSGCIHGCMMCVVSENKATAAATSVALLIVDQLHVDSHA